MIGKVDYRVLSVVSHSRMTIGEGISHSPKEFTSAQDMANGASVLLRTVLEIDGRGLE